MGFEPTAAGSEDQRPACLAKVARSGRFELPTFGSEDQRSNPLSYERKYGGQVYPVELQRRMERVSRIELPSSPWKGDVIAVIRHPLVF